MESNQLLANLTTAQKALLFTRMCELVDQATLGLKLLGRPLSVKELLDELSVLENPALVVNMSPFTAALDFACRNHKQDFVMFGDIHGIAPPIVPRMLGAGLNFRTKVTDMFKVPDNLTLKAVSQGVQWRKKLKSWGYGITSEPDGFGKVALTLKRHGRTLTLVQGTSVPHANPIGPSAFLDPFMLHDLRAAGALIEKL